jgi:hypothetical protein
MSVYLWYNFQGPKEILNEIGKRLYKLIFLCLILATKLISLIKTKNLQ